MNLDSCYKDIILFNLAGGNLPSTAIDDDFWFLMKNQNKRATEELSETTNAIANKDAKSLLDGVVDEFVVLAGKIYMLECAGFNVDLALSKICKNNFAKITTDINTAQKWLNEQSGVRLVESVVGGVTYYSIKRNTDNKIMKHVDFVNVDINDCVPKE